MLPIRRILHPTDFSARSENALQLASALAHDYGATLMMLHVIHEPTIMYAEGVIPPDPDESRAEARGELSQVRPPHGDILVERRIEEGSPPIEILRVADETQADLIVMGTHGRTGLMRMVMGSVAEEVVRKAHCPVLTVTDPAATATSDDLSTVRPMMQPV